MMTPLRVVSSRHLGYYKHCIELAFVVAPEAVSVHRDKDNIPIMYM